ncbi:MAG: DUF2950 domain-containing protein [Propionivibrio sp.]
MAVAFLQVAVAADADKENNMMTNLNVAKELSVHAQPSRFASTFLSYALALLFSMPLLGVAAEQQTFASPEEAVQNLIEALQSEDDSRLIAIFGEEHKRLVVSPDKAENSAMHAKALAALQAFHVLEQTTPTRTILLVGTDAWPLPIPLVREKGVWRFATEVGEDEIINRRIGTNEREAINSLRAYLDAQRQYASRDRNDDEVLEYAQKLASTPGKKDGLYWEADTTAGEEASPFGPLIAASGEYLQGHAAGDAFRGYHFRILKRQGKNAPGGAFSYLINGRMIAGFAMVAYPAEYGVTGVMTFIVSNTGTIYEKNLGKTGAQIKEFNPDASWNKVDSAS